MNSLKKIKYIYVGLDSKTPIILSKNENFKLVAVSQIEYFFIRTKNPVNLIFKSIFYLRRKEKLRWLEVILVLIWKFLKHLSSSIFFTFKNYLTLISKYNVEILNFEDIKKVEEYIKNNNIDLMIVNAWDLLPKNIVELPKYGTINIHPAKLPKYRGALPTLWALKNKDKESAVSYILLDNSVDGGKIINQHSFPISEGDDAISLEYKIQGIIKKTLAKDIAEYVNGKIIPQKQFGEISFTAKYEEYKKIDWQNEDGKNIYNKIKLYPYLVPGDYCYAIINGKKVFIKDAKFIPESKIYENAIPGQFKRKLSSILFQTKSGIIKARVFNE